MIHKFSVHSKLDSGGPEYLRRHLPDLETWRDYYIEVSSTLDDTAIATILGVLGDPMLEHVAVGEPLPSNAVQVAYQRGIVDNENDSIVGLCQMHGISAVASKVAVTYASVSTSLATVIEAEAFNANIEELHVVEPHYETLLPAGEYAPMELFDLRGLDNKQLLDIGRGNGRSLELDKMQLIAKIQNDTGAEHVSDALLEALDARWSDHCAHTTWKSLGNLLGRMVQSSKATNNANVVSMFHDNAGIWDFYDGQAITVKAETHNGPSAVSAYFGQLTKVGGVLRDILGTGLGSDPIGVFEYTATGLPESPSPTAGRPTPKKIAQETIRAVKEYGNTFGVPMMASHMTFHDEYRAKPFALGGSIGIIPKEYAQRGRPQPGDCAVLIGGLTGNDGIHGASASSAGAQMDTTSVQIGSPLEEIKFREAILELRDAGCLRAITDLGAAGVNSAFGEMGEDVGVWINTALVPLKTGGLPMWRILLSESQERMALAIDPLRLDDARKIMAEHEVRNTVIGRFTGNQRYCVVHDENISESDVLTAEHSSMPLAREVGFDLDYTHLGYRPADRQVGQPRQSWRIESEWPSLKPDAIAEIMGGLVRDSEIQDQSFASSQYDSSVGGRSYYGPTIGDRYRVPTGYWAARPIYGSNAAVVFNSSFNPWLFEAHPVLAARQTLLAVLAGQVLAGVQLHDICLCDNFYTPHRESDSDEWLVAMVEEVASLAERFGTPFISGKDSSAGSVETDEGLVSVPPAVYVSGLGKVPTVERLRSEQWTTAGNLLVRVGVACNSLAGTATARVLDLEANDVDDISVDEAADFIAALAALSLDDVPSARMLTAGGVLGAALSGTLSSAAVLEKSMSSAAVLEKSMSSAAVLEQSMSSAAVLEETPSGAFGAELTCASEDCSDLLREYRIGALLEVRPEALDALPAELNAVVVGRITSDAESIVVNGTPVLSGNVISTWQSSFQEELS